jgi:hypothetical protein
VTLERRLVRLESVRGPQRPLAHLKDSELLMLTAEMAGADPETVAALDEEERQRAAFEERPDIREAIEQNIAAGNCPPQEALDEAFRWPHLLRHFQWHERQYPR